MTRRSPAVKLGDNEGQEMLEMLWPTYSDGTRIEAGQRVRVYSSQFGVWHHGIVGCVFYSARGFVIQIIHNTKEHGVAVSHWNEFSAGHPVFLHSRPASPEHARRIVKTAEANIGKPYSAFAQNCEHFASFCFTGEAESETLQAFGKVAAIFFVAWGLSE